MNRSYYFLLPLILCLALVWAIVPMASDTPSLTKSSVTQSQSAEPPVQSAPDAAVYAEAKDVTAERQVYMIAKEYKGKLCLFSSDNDSSPSITLDVNIALLPKADRDMFGLGVNLYSQSEVTRLIEDYTS